MYKSYIFSVCKWDSLMKLECSSSKNISLKRREHWETWA